MSDWFVVRVKVTLIRLLNGLETVTSGHIYINEKTLQPKRKELLRERQNTAMIFPTFQSFMVENIEENWFGFSLEMYMLRVSER